MSLPDASVIENQILELENFELTMNPQLLDSTKFIPHPSIPTPGDFYFQLLGLYLIKMDLISAKFLCKRIPSSVKSSHPSLESLWNLGRLLWRNDLPLFFASANRILEDSFQPQSLVFIVQKLLSDKQESVLCLIENAYSCISIEHVTRWLGLPEEKLQAIISSRDWEICNNKKYFFPRRKKIVDDSFQVQASNTELMSKLAEFMCFIENH
ncbi:unnamed protein product [Protopolystoma xenopodis]|uniref:COP9 signalosome complex subunit 8 n=1 Tax=Protopolystoma xenopodis TaxID=117903 RepID=A0A3S5CLY8_9PLAT|nr:unnamed protein product [Protopolystoma xenopodis]